MYRFGTLVFTVAKPATQIIALYLAPIMLIAPLASVTILLNAVIAPLCAGASIRNLDLLIGVMIMAGCLGTTAAGAHNSQSWSYPELVTLGLQCSLPTFSLIGSLVGLSILVKKARSRLSTIPCGIVLVALIPSLASALNNVMLKALLNAITSAPWYALIVLVAIVVGTAFVQVWSTSIGVQLFDMLAFVPVQVSAQILVTTAYSSIFYEEMPSNGTAFALATLAIIVGVLLFRCTTSETPEDYIQLEAGAKENFDSPGSTQCPSEMSEESSA